MKGKDCDWTPPAVATRFRVWLSSLEHVEAEVVIVSKWQVSGVFAYAIPERVASVPWNGTAR